MAYFIHNKYDAASVAALGSVDTSVHTVIDYYDDYEAYKNLDTSAGFGTLYEELAYITPETVVYDGQVDNTGSHFNFSSSLIIRSIQIGAFCFTAATKSITIQNINPNKSFVLLNGSNSRGDYSDAPSLSGLTKDTLVIQRQHTSGGCSGSYQIIETM